MGVPVPARFVAQLISSSSSLGRAIPHLYTGVQFLLLTSECSFSSSLRSAIPHLDTGVQFPSSSSTLVSAVLPPLGAQILLRCR